MLFLDDICIRALKRSDSEVLYRAINNPRVVKFNAPFEPIHEIDHLAWLEKTLTDNRKKFFIIEKNLEPIGSVQLFDINMIHRHAEVSIRLFDEKYCGNQSGTKALSLVCDFAFNDVGLVRIWLRVFEDNHRAIAAYKKNGFIEEGIMTKAAFIKGEFCNVVIMAKLHHD